MAVAFAGNSTAIQEMFKRHPLPAVVPVINIPRVGFCGMRSCNHFLGGCLVKGTYGN